MTAGMDSTDACSSGMRGSSEKVLWSLVLCLLATLTLLLLSGFMTILVDGDQRGEKYFQSDENLSKAPQILFDADDE